MISLSHHYSAIEFLNLNSFVWYTVSKVQTTSVFNNWPSHCLCTKFDHWNPRFPSTFCFSHPLLLLVWLSVTISLLVSGLFQSPPPPPLSSRSSQDWSATQMTWPLQSNAPLLLALQHMCSLETSKTRICLVVTCPEWIVLSSVIG